MRMGAELAEHLATTTTATTEEGRQAGREMKIMKILVRCAAAFLEDSNRAGINWNFGSDAHTLIYLSF